MNETLPTIYKAPNRAHPSVVYCVAREEKKKGVKERETYHTGNAVQIREKRWRVFCATVRGWKGSKHRP